MKKFFTNVVFFFIWGANSIYSIKDLRLSTPISLPTTACVLVGWFLFLTYFFIF